MPAGLFKGIHPKLPNNPAVTKQTHTPFEFGLARPRAINSHPEEGRGVCACRTTHRSAPKKRGFAVSSVSSIKLSSAWVAMLCFFSLTDALQTQYYFTCTYASVSALPSISMLTRMAYH